MLELQKIRVFPDPVLRIPAKAIDRPDKNLASLLRRAAPEYAVGLAAPQLGILRQGILLRRDEGDEILWNPQIRGSGKTSLEVEGCLSLPGEEWEIARWDKVLLRARDENWNIVERQARGWEARIIQHEVDHLRGILISDRGRRV